ncbi:MAG: sigma-54-dependent Fis family transcriptional regulator [Deltaproteobacteria bacterium]|nr:sigma-54-dependent Fis family transcriptional regulator [Deltaproteobacteria bacterium]
MIERKKRVLIVDDDRAIHLATKYVLRGKYDCLSAYNGDEAMIVAQSQPVDVILLDIHMRHEGEGLAYVPRLREIDSDLDIIIVSANTEIDLASRAMKAGSSAYLLKEHSADQLIITIESVLSKREVVRENQHYVRDRSRVLEKNKIIGNSPAISQLMRDIEKVRRSRANVVILGDTGSGKELVARHIGAIGGHPFVAVDSATIMSSMAESILFGHEKGAFTGAQGQTKGLFEEAHGGTIYFDEIANMPLEIQAKLLRVIEEKEVTRLGSTKTIPLDFRVICATNKDLETQITEGKFKDDLYQRLSVITLRIPPLRERSEDIPALISHFFGRFRYENSARQLSDGAMEMLTRYSWPGNIRELSNLVANLCTMVVDREIVEVEDLPAKIRDHVYRGKEESVPLEAFNEADMDFYKYMHALEGKVLRDLYKAHGGNISQMSKSLRVSRSHLYSKLNAHGIQ